MSKRDYPVLLVTRPEQASEAFLAQMKATGALFEAVTSPAFENEAADIDIPQFEAAVFTSAAGVRFAPAGLNRTAYCVGQATATAAHRSGYRALSSDGVASDLVALILERQPREKLLHIRGETSIGDVTDRLTSAGISCADVIVYRKAQMVPTQAALTALGSDREIILPLFSAETVSILKDWNANFASCNVVAMSAAVAQEAGTLHPANVVISKHPNQQSMVEETACLIA